MASAPRSSRSFPVPLRVRFIILAFLALIPIVGFSLYNGIERRHAAEQDAYDEIIRAVHFEAKTQHVLIENAEQLLLALSHIPEVKDGQKNPQGCSNLLFELQADTSRYTNIGVASLDGNVFCSAVPLTNPVTVQDRLYFQHAVSSRRFSVGEYQIEPQSGKATIGFGYPVFDNKHNVQGVVFAELDLTWIDQLIRTLDVPAGGTVLVVDHAGTILARTPDPEDWVGKTILENPLIRAILAQQGDGAVESVGLDGVERFYAFAPLTAASDPNFVALSIGLPLDMVLLDAQNATRRDILLLALLAGLATAMALLGSELMVVRRIKHLARATERLTEGDLSVRIMDDSGDEIGELGIAFNSMAIELKTSYDTLEEKVEQKTSELRKEIQKVETSKKALTNLLEDLESGKKKIEEDSLRNAALLLSIGEGIVATDENGTVLSLNAAGEQLLGRKADELIGKKMTESTLAEDENGQPIESEAHPLNVALVTLLPISRSVVYVRTDGTKVHTRTTATPILMNKRAVGAIAVFRDSSKEFEIDKAKTEFVSLASHQLRTPLTAIRWFCELLLNGEAGKLTKKQKEYVQDLTKSTGRMIELVAALLNVSRIDLGVFVIEPKPIILPDIAEGVLKDLGAMLQKKKTRVEKEYDGVSEYIGDPKLLEIMFQNLLSNAIKYTPEKGKVRLEMAKKDDAILITVSDNGFGIPKAQQEKIFGKLFRADNVIKKAVEGTGLGLYTVKSFIESSGGKIWFESEEGKGSTFYVSLPAAGMKKKEGSKALEAIKTIM